MTYKNKRRYHKPKKTHKNKRKSHLKKKRTLRMRGGKPRPKRASGIVSSLGKAVGQAALDSTLDALGPTGKAVGQAALGSALGSAVGPTDKGVGQLSISKKTKSLDNPEVLLERVGALVGKVKEKTKNEKLVDKEKELAIVERDEQIKEIIREFGDKLTSSSPPPRATTKLSSTAVKDQQYVNKEVEYEEKQIKKGLVAFPSGEAEFFQLINLKGKQSSPFKNKAVSVSYASIRGKALKKILKSVPIPSNYIFSVGGEVVRTTFKDKHVYVPARHVIIKPNEALELHKYLKKHKGYYLVVGHYEKDGTGEYLYRLPHRGFIDCSGKNIVLMTTRGDKITYAINDKPEYRFIGLKKDSSHGELLTMMEALLVLKGKPEFLTVTQKFLKQLGQETGAGTVKDIVISHLSRLSKSKNPKGGSQTLDDLYSLVSGGCDQDEAKDRLKGTQAPAPRKFKLVF